MSMNHKSFFLSFAIVLMANSIKVLARSIDTSGSETPTNSSFIKLPTIVCIVGVVAVAVSGGFCLFSKKHKRTPSEEYLKNDNSSNTSNSSSNSPNTTSSELRQLNNESNEMDITVKVDKMEDADKKEESEKLDVHPKRKSILDSILSRKKEHRTSNIQFKEDRSLNSISTNEDWINEQKLQAELNNENQEDLYDDDDEDLNSNDGFWNSDLEPIQTASENKALSYGVPSLGKRNSVIVKDSDPKANRQSVVIDENGNVIEADKASEKSAEFRPARVKSWKNNDYDKELREILKNIDVEDGSLSK